MPYIGRVTKAERRMRERGLIHSLIPADGARIEMREVIREGVKVGIDPNDVRRYLKRLVSDRRLTRETELTPPYRIYYSKPLPVKAEPAPASVPEYQQPEQEEKPALAEQRDLRTIHGPDHFMHRLRCMPEHESGEFVARKKQMEDVLWDYRDRGFKRKINLGGGKRWLCVRKWNKQEKRMEYIGELDMATELAAYRVFVSGGKSPAQLERQKKLKKLREIRRELIGLEDHEDLLKELAEARGWTLEEAEEALKLKRGTLSKRYGARV